MNTAMGAAEAVTAAVEQTRKAREDWQRQVRRQTAAWFTLDLVLMVALIACGWLLYGSRGALVALAICGVLLVGLTLWVRTGTRRQP